MQYRLSEIVRNYRQTLTTLNEMLKAVMLNWIKIGYYSVRRRPSSRAILVVEPLYRELLQIEKQNGVAASLTRLNSILSEKGVTYDQFVFDLQK